VEAAAWAAGALLAMGPPPVTLTALALVAGLAAEAARQRGLGASLDTRLDSLGRVHGAGQRMVAGPPQIDSVVARLCAECANVAPFHWLRLDLLPEAGDLGRTWWAAGTGEVLPEAPDPGPHPPPIPGIHRRSEWQLEERSLGVGGKPVARLTLWCDPRQLDDGDLALLDALLPQMAASIQQALLDREAREDRLTGAAVRRVLEKRLFEAFGRAVEEGTSLAVIMCDVDRFKAVNDRHGHAGGDRALAAVAAVLAHHKRTEDLLARYGGEEFTLLLEGADGATALAVAERLRLAVAELAFEHLERPVPLTVSCGVAACPEVHVKTPSELLLLADAALYEAKRQGRNRCLLDLGRGRYLTPDGESLITDDPRPEPPPPRIFA
jgi:diguanylate cyclase (GGDEF)-like protein